MAKSSGYEVDFRGKYTVNGGKLVVFGDLHLDPHFMGKHLSYETTCIEVMDSIVSHVKSEGAGAVIFAGDLIGVNSKNIVDRRFLLKVMQFFEFLNTLTDGNVYAVKGNHDMGDFTDFDFLQGMNLFKNPEYIDYAGDDGIEIRFHFVNYGDEHEKLSLHPVASNVVIGHNDYYIDGVTTWYSEKGVSVELNKLENFNGVELVLGGHIHEPSEEFLFTTMPNGREIGLFYLGNPTRVMERIEDCWYIVFQYIPENMSSDYECKLFGLKPLKDEFYKDEDFDHEVKEDEEKEARRKEVLSEVIDEVMGSKLYVGNLFQQIDLLPGRDEAKALAKEYLEKAGKEIE